MVILMIVSLRIVSKPFIYLPLKLLHNEWLFGDSRWYLWLQGLQTYLAFSSSYSLSRLVIAWRFRSWWADELIWQLYIMLFRNGIQVNLTILNIINILQFESRWNFFTRCSFKRNSRWTVRTASLLQNWLKRSFGSMQIFVQFDHISVDLNTNIVPINFLIMCIN